jgi:hypothetical protein
VGKITHNKIILMSMTEKDKLRQLFAGSLVGKSVLTRDVRCLTCRSWTGESVGGGKRNCERFGPSSNAPAYVNADCLTPEYVATDMNFACSMWEPKS